MYPAKLRRRPASAEAGKFAWYKMSRDLPCTRPNFAGGRSRPQTGACLPLRRLQDAKQAPVYPYADCRAPNRRLFTLTQIAGHQTGACLPLRRLQDAKQAPVYPYADCRAPNRRLFTLTQIAGHQTGACLPLRRLQDAKQAPVYPYADCRAPNRRLFTLTQASAEAEEVYPGTRQTSLPPQGPCLAS